MQTISFWFPLSVFIAWIVFAANASVSWKKTIFLIINCLYLLSFCFDKDDTFGLGILGRLIPLIGFLMLGYCSVLVIQKYKKMSLLVVSLVIQLLLFLYLKNYASIALLPLLPSSVIIVGLSYVFFRIIHLQVEATNGALSCPPSPISYINYCLSFLTLQAGPIQRWSDYSEQEQEMKNFSWRRIDLLLLFSRATNGFVKVLLLGTGFERLHQWTISLNQGLLATSIAILSYLLYLYFNFSGFIDISIALGLAFGFNLPENFNDPLLSDNFLDFWSRWNITLSEWFKEYVFTPIFSALIRMSHLNWSLAIGCFSFLVTFLLMGLWHGSTRNFLYYGLAIGFGVVLNKLFQEVMRRNLGKKRYASVKNHFAYRTLASSLALAFFELTLVFLWAKDLDQIRVLLPSIAQLIGVFLFVWVWTTIIQLCWRVLNRIKVGTSCAESISAPYLALRIFLVIGLIFIHIDQPIVVVYKVF